MNLVTKIKCQFHFNCLYRNLIRAERIGGACYLSKALKHLNILLLLDKNDELPYVSLSFLESLKINLSKR